MNIVSTLTKADQQKLQQALEQLSEQTTLPQTLERLFKNWELFTNRIEDGYRLSLTNYTNSLGGRQFLAEIEQSLSETGQAIFRTGYSSIDNRFYEATIEAQQPLHAESTPDQWWYYRIPQKLLEDLKNDLVADGHFYLL